MDDVQEMPGMWLEERTNEEIVVEMGSLLGDGWDGWMRDAGPSREEV